MGVAIMNGARVADFLTPEQFAQEQARRMESARGRLLIAGCRSGTPLAARVAQRYNDMLRDAGSEETVRFAGDIDRIFSDSETTVRLECHVGGYDVFLFQSLFDPCSSASVDQNYMAFMIAARTFREHGASHVTGVLPYLAYARQDKPTNFKREPVTAKLLADLTLEAGVDRIVAWDPHSAQIRGFYGGFPVSMLESLTLFIEEFRRFEGREDVIAVAPDAGASKFVTHFGRALGLKCAIAAKYRPAPEQSVISEIIGDFAEKRVAIVLDDMVAGGGTLAGLIQKLSQDKGIEETHVGVSHNLCLSQARDRLCDLHENYGLQEFITTNSITQTPDFAELPFMKVRCLSDALAKSINRIHYNRSVSEVFYRP